MDYLRKPINGGIAIGIVLIAFVVASIAIFFAYRLATDQSDLFGLFGSGRTNDTPILSTNDLSRVKQFTSVEEFVSYLEESQSDSSYSGAFGFGSTARLSVSPDIQFANPLAAEGIPQNIVTANSIGDSYLGAGPSRFSQTNVQVQGIDEPDIVKTDGEEIYFSRGTLYGYFEPEPLLFEEDVLSEYYYPRTSKAEIKVLKAFPPEAVEVESSIKRSGDLLLHEDMLVVFAGQKIYGYDVSDPSTPEEKWDMELDDQNTIVQSRLFNGKMYVVMRNRINYGNPCPIIPFSSGGRAFSIPCTDVFYPQVPVPSDSTFIAMVVDPVTGDIEEQVSFVGFSGSSIVYMSETAVYITYSYTNSLAGLLLDFVIEEQNGIFPKDIVEKIKKLRSYDISDQGKLTEFGVILESYLARLDKDEKWRVESELTNQLLKYVEKRKREIERTGIVKISLDGFTIEAVGEVPGFPINQFALDEYKGNLRIATTVGDSFGFRGGIEGLGASGNDVYVLDGQLNSLGSVQDLGITEKIFSVRFVGDRAYVVTFRQTDPFYVLDLSDPKNPELKGELKIPGFSSYLHPVNAERILGIGQETWRVKVSLFDVSDPENPKEADKYILDEGWSEVQNTHHAFLLDSKHNVFFLPGGKGGYVFSYEDDKLALERVVVQSQVKRALFFDDFLYVIGTQKITILNENNWKETVREIDLD